MPASELVDDKKAHVVPGALIFAPRIPEADDQPALGWNCDFTPEHRPVA
jgi:hypothetical protein